MDILKNLRRERNNYLFAAFMFAATSGGAFWLANSMDEGERFDVHGRLPQTAEMHEFANDAEKLLLAPCAIFPLLSAANFFYRRRKYEETKELAAALSPPALKP